MKKLVLLVAVVFAFGLFFGTGVRCVYAKEYKIGYVDLGRVFDEYKNTKESEKALEEKGKPKRESAGS